MATEKLITTGPGSVVVAALRLSAVVCALALLAACDNQDEAEGQRGGGFGSGREGRGPGGSRRPAAAIPVKAEPVVRGDMFAHLETYARLEAERQVTVLARTTGLVERLRVEEGSTVRAGQILVELDPEAANLQLRRAQAALAEAKSNFDRFQNLHQSNMVSQTEFEATRLAYQSSGINLEEAQLNLAYTTIRSPMPGIITRRLVELGDLVRGNQEVFVVADLDLLLARVFIPERSIYKVHPDQVATISVEALPGQTFDARVRMVSPEVIAESGTVKVTLEVPAGGRLKPGMFATVRLITDRRPQTLMIPKEALVLETEEDDVLVVADSTVRSVPVELGLAEEGWVEVLSGVAEGDMLVTVGHDGLKDGSAVRIVGLETAMKPNADSAADSATARPRRERP